MTYWIEEGLGGRAQKQAHLTMSKTGGMQASAHQEMGFLKTGVPDAAGNETEPSASEEAQPSSVFASRNHGYQEQAYDTVVDTFGLCSHADPVAVLQVQRSPSVPDVLFRVDDPYHWICLAGTGLNS